ncbi:hypothetical protein HG536_0D05405 [Torulaspora globosa]|uniref:Uncharacterized protein n=1 Tax=Torulaspora globosa TaxID=48254 RepID=A0A7G3ZHN3_9SACH|nr:uncharacterized protein HG536_0D05405 [Torulaspora globosa]QLL33019.1 hypothetical protein HG536_0D05405 [Torulaspora globosa]
MAIAFLASCLYQENAALGMIMALLRKLLDVLSVRHKIVQVSRRTSKKNRRHRAQRVTRYDLLKAHYQVV